MNLNYSRKQIIKNKNIMALNEKLKRTTHIMRNSFTFVGASTLAASLTTPHVQAEASEVKVQTATVANPFLSSIIPAATSIAEKNDLYASVMMAQAILESGWGQSALAQAPNHNLFGIKGDYEGETVEMKTLEDDGNQNYYEIKAEFRKYPSYSESLEDYAQLLRNGTSWDPQYYSGAWKSNAATYQDATQYLTGRYATDTAYATKLNRIIETHELNAYDTPSSTGAVSSTPVATPTPKPEGTAHFYEVKSGDTLFAIAARHGITVVQLMEWNQLNSSNIYPGMSLQVGVITNQQAEKPVVSAPVIKPISNIGTTYTVKAGDSLWKISQSYGITVAQLKTLNGLKNDIITPGQVLMTASTPKDTKPAPAPVKDKTPDAASNGTYKIKAGDTLSRIAFELGTTVAELKTANQLKSDMIYPGQTLVYGKQAANTTENKTVTVTPVENKAPAASYTVKNGDSLFKIANQFGVTVAQLKEVNNLRSDIIYPGQVLLSNKVEAPKEIPVQKVESFNATYVVRPGDTLFKIASQAGASVAQIKQWNSLTSDLIFVGQTLNLNDNQPAKQEESQPVVTNRYTVKAGDTLYSIARLNGISVTQLMEWNDITSSTIYPGQSLRVQ